jgi:hypothetical protein
MGKEEGLARAEAGRSGRVHSHPTLHQLERFMRCELSRAEVSAVVRHLLTDCPQCVEVSSRLFKLAKRPADALQVLLEEATRQERRRHLELL